MKKKLAIKSHSTRGKEVIELLEMLGGVNDRGYTGTNTWKDEYYTLDNGYIRVYDWSDDIKFTLEEFLNKYPFRVGDKVHIYVQNDDTDGRYDIEVAEISSIRWNPARCKIAYKMKDINREFYKEEIKCKVDDNKSSGTVDNPVEIKSLTVSLKDDKAIDNPIDTLQFMQLGKIAAVCFNIENYENEVELKLGDYEIVVRNGKTYATKKTNLYPKTYKECCDILNAEETYLGIGGHKGKLLQHFQRLLICRDAYWKIAGEQMGLGKPWEPDWDKTIKDCIEIVYGSVDYTAVNDIQSCILAFPTEEMRDVFYENFKDLIEQCKELL